MSSAEQNRPARLKLPARTSRSNSSSSVSEQALAGFGQTNYHTLTSFLETLRTVNDFDQLHDRRGTRALKWHVPGNDGVWRELGPPSKPLLEVTPIPMWLADMEFPAPQSVIDALLRRVEHGIFGYTTVDDTYFDTIINWMARRHGWQIHPDWILTTSGVMPTINLLIQTFSQPGDGVVVQTPVFHPISEAVENNERVPLRNSLRYTDGQYAMDFEDLARKASDPCARMLVLCSPHNPVGRVWRHEELRNLAEICEENHLLLISDEIHGDLTYNWADFQSVGAVDERFLERLVICTSPSKAFNLPGLKTSLTIIPNTSVREKFQITLRNQNALFGVNTLGTTAIQAAYEHGEVWLEQLIDYLAGNLQYVERFIDEHVPALRLVRPEALYLVWIDCRGLDLDMAVLPRVLKDEAGVWVEPGATYGMEGEGFIRMNIACPRVMLTEALNRIRGAIR